MELLESEVFHFICYFLAPIFTFLFAASTIISLFIPEEAKKAKKVAYILFSVSMMLALFDYFYLWLYIFWEG